jgi:hypothetical protein
VAVILPTVLGTLMFEAGMLNCGMLKKLKNSARNCNRILSVSRKFLKAEKSMLCMPGPVNTFLPGLPMVNGAWTWKAVKSNHKSLHHRSRALRNHPESAAGPEQN